MGGLINQPAQSIYRSKFIPLFKVVVRLIHFLLARFLARMPQRQPGQAMRPAGTAKGKATKYIPRQKTTARRLRCILTLVPAG